MTESYAFFGGTPEDPRQYNQIEFAEVLERFFRNGYFPGVGTEVAVFPTDPARLAVRVGTGQAWINGYWYKNDTWKEIDLAPADDTNDRIDRIVLRLDTVNARNIEAVVKTGIPAVNPTAPDLERTEQIYELSLATVRVNNGATSITASNITDTRDDEIVCGRAVPWNVPTDEDLYQHVSDNVRHITASERNTWNAKETPAGAQAKVDAHANVTSAHGATSAATANRIVMRDGNGRAAVANPVNNDHIANKQYVDDAADAAEQAAIEWAKSFGLGTNSKYIGSQDLNNLTETGFYSGHLLVNGPSEAHTSGFVIHVEYRVSGFAFQIFAEVGSNERMYYRLKRDDVWNDWKRIWNSVNLSSPARTDVDNNFTRRQTVKNGSNYEYIGVRRDVSGTEYGAEVAVSSSGYAQLVKRDGGNIVESIDIRGAGDARVGSNPIWTNGNQGNPNNLNTSSKQIVGAINELFTTVSNGKQAIRDAIADAGGTPPSGSPDQYTHQDLAAAISTVSKYASGEEPTSSTTSMTVQVRGINFDVDVLTGAYQTSDDGLVAFTIIYYPDAGGWSRLFVNKASTAAADPVITKVSGGFDITISRPAGTGFDWEAWGGRS